MIQQQKQRKETVLLYMMESWNVHGFPNNSVAQTELYMAFKRYKKDARVRKFSMMGLIYHTDDACLCDAMNVCGRWQACERFKHCKGCHRIQISSNFWKFSSNPPCLASSTNTAHNLCPHKYQNGNIHVHGDLTSSSKYDQLLSTCPPLLISLSHCLIIEEIYILIWAANFPHALLAHSH